MSRKCHEILQTSPNAPSLVSKLWQQSFCACVPEPVVGGAGDRCGRQPAAATLQSPVKLLECIPRMLEPRSTLQKCGWEVHKSGCVTVYCMVCGGTTPFPRIPALPTWVLAFLRGSYCRLSFIQAAGCGNSLQRLLARIRDCCGFGVSH